ncbi:hypothetical protein STVIR_3793 [Streptomyces viridochromogenes Tue57]|uniref:Uncharacterized protein n=1 Tax=Streptomyces viridochromogenes Tue57 TaxID=1160705 RepID=L8PCH3_STRVR|nr:hypothetical protein STVIR_3793 [Streptomyces viridochromogenes Tue57]
MRCGGLGPPEGTVALKAGERERVLKVLQLRRRDEDGGRNTAVRQGDVPMPGSPTGKFTEPTLAGPCCGGGSCAEWPAGLVARHFLGLPGLADGRRTDNHANPRPQP